MNFVFRAYPTHPWMTNWAIEARGCTTAFRERNRECFFKSTETVGRIIPDLESPQWALQIPAPQNSHTTLLFNGFCTYMEKRKNRFIAEVFTPEPGIIWGQFDNIPLPVLLSDEPIVESEGFQWIENDQSPALLAVRENTFCLVTKSPIRSDAEKLAGQYLDQNIEDFLQEELAHRSGASSFFEQMSHHDSLAVISTECLMRSLRPPEGKIPQIWSQSAESGSAHYNINDLYPLVMAWRHIDIGVAAELVHCALHLQVSSGAIPVVNTPHGNYSILEAPKPLLAKITETVWNENRDSEFLKAAIPALRRHLQWILHHFDPKKRGLHSWQNSSEALVPHLFETDLSTVDLTVLILTEIEALNRLREQCPGYEQQPPYFPDELEVLKDNLINHFWNEEDTAFTNAFVRGNVTRVQGFPSFAPLLWKNLPGTYRTPILDRLRQADFLPGGLSILSWQKSSMSEDVFPLIQQSIILQSIKTTDPQGTLLSDFSRITLQGFMEWHTLSLEAHQALDITPTMAAYVLSVQNTHQYRYHAKGRTTGKLAKVFRKAKVDSFDLAVVAVTIFAVLSVHVVYRVLNAPPPFGVIEAQMNSEYTNKAFDQCLGNCRNIIRFYPEQATEAQLLAGNILMYMKDYPAAEKMFGPVRAAAPDSPGPMISLGLAYQLQGRFTQAEQQYAEFCFLFDQIFPDLVREVNQLRMIMEEGFPSPPNWIDIYRYEMMHEL